MSHGPRSPFAQPGAALTRTAARQIPQLRATAGSATPYQRRRSDRPPVGLLLLQCVAPAEAVPAQRFDAVPVAPCLGTTRKNELLNMRRRLILSSVPAAAALTLAGCGGGGGGGTTSAASGGATTGSTGVVETTAPPATASSGSTAASGSGYAFGSRQTPYVAGILPSQSNAAMDAMLAAQYDRWKAARVVAADSIVAGGYAVQFSDANFLTVSEGMGYGLLLAVVFAGHDPNAQRLFDGLLSVVRTRYAY